MKNLPIALQLYSVREDAARDFPGVLKQVAAMGYDGVEFAGYHNFPAKELRAILDGEGLKVAGAHVGLPTLMGDELAKSIEFHQILGNRFLIVPGLAEEYRNSIAAWKKTAGIFNQLVDQLQPHGMWTGYHNHTHEFTQMDGEYPWDAFFSTARPEVVMQLDTGNALHGGADVTPWLARYPGRALTVHLKEHSKTNDKALIGEGDVRWADIFNLCETQGNTEWYIIEQESYAYPPMDCVDRCLKNLRAMRAGA